MAICKECGGTSWEKICNLFRRRVISASEHEALASDGALWQCKKCRRVVHYSDFGDGTLPASDVIV